MGPVGRLLERNDEFVDNALKVKNSDAAASFAKYLTNLYATLMAAGHAERILMAKNEFPLADSND